MVLSIIQVLSTIVRAVMMLPFGVCGSNFDEYLGFKYICVCRYDVICWWFGL